MKPGVSKPPFETPSNVESSGGSLSTGSSGEEDSQAKAKAKPKPKLKKWKGRKRGHKRPKKSKPEKKPNPVNAPDTTAAAKNMDMVSHWCSVLCCPLSIVLLAILLFTRLFLRRKGNRLREQDRHHEQGQIYVDANHAHREYDRATVARTVDKMRKSKGPKSRRNALGTGLTELRLTESQPALWEEYCRVCTDATLEKVASLKTTKAKQRRIDNMIEELSTSPISEHVRNELIARLQSPPEPQDPPKPDVIDIELG